MFRFLDSMRCTLLGSLLYTPPRMPKFSFVSKCVQPQQSHKPCSIEKRNFGGRHIRRHTTECVVTASLTSKELFKLIYRVHDVIMSIKSLDKQWTGRLKLVSLIFAEY